MGVRSPFLYLISNVTVETSSSTYVLNKRSICMLKRRNHNFIYILHTCSHRHVIHKKGKGGGGGHTLKWKQNYSYNETSILTNNGPCL